MRSTSVLLGLLATVLLGSLPVSANESALDAATAALEGRAWTAGHTVVLNDQPWFTRADGSLVSAVPALPAAACAELPSTEGPVDSALFVLFPEEPVGLLVEADVARLYLWDGAQRCFVFATIVEVSAVDSR